jgi:hypothetical protein
LEKYAEYPDDQRNKETAEALEILAGNLGKVPPDHPLLRQLCLIDTDSSYHQEENQYIFLSTAVSTPVTATRRSFCEA